MLAVTCVDDIWWVSYVGYTQSVLRWRDEEQHEQRERGMECTRREKERERETTVNGFISEWCHQNGSCALSLKERERKKKMRVHFCSVYSIERERMSVGGGLCVCCQCSIVHVVSCSFLPRTLHVNNEWKQCECTRIKREEQDEEEKRRRRRRRRRGEDEDAARTLSTSSFNEDRVSVSQWTHLK